MTIRYTVTRADLVRAQLRSLFRQPILLVTAGLILISFVVSVLTLPEINAQSWGAKLVAALASTLLVSMLIIVFGLVIVTLQVLTKRHHGVLGEHTLTITDQGLVESTAHNESLFRWAGIHRLIATRSALYIYVNDTMFFYVPRRRPLLAGDLGSFEARLRERLTGHQRRPAENES